jgi:hypothetical protein
MKESIVFSTIQFIKRKYSPFRPKIVRRNFIAHQTSRERFVDFRKRAGQQSCRQWGGAGHRDATHYQEGASAEKALIGPHSQPHSLRYAFRTLTNPIQLIFVCFSHFAEIRYPSSCV